MPIIPIIIAENDRATASTGPLDQYYSYRCEHCGVETAAMVRASGWARGPNQYAADRAALMAAGGHAWRANLAAACPRCEKLQPPAIALFERAAKSARRRRVVAPVLGGVFAVATLGAGLPYAIEDLRHSLLLLGVAVTTASAVGALVYIIASLNEVLPTTDPNGVWFSLDPSQGPSSWFPARAGAVPPIPTQNKKARTLAAIVMTVSACVALAAAVLWTGTFRTIYVINTAGVRGPMKVILDGKDAGVVESANGGPTSDVPFRAIEVRDDSPHQVVLEGPDDFRETYELDSKRARHGWVLAPRARDRGLCILSYTQHYGRGPLWRDSENGILNKQDDGDRMVLDRKFEVVFTSPPDRVETKDGHEKKTTLRAVQCAALERDTLSPFGNGRLPDPGPASPPSSQTPE